MKRFFILSIISIIAAISASAQISTFFDRYSDAKNVTSVYISKAMLSMIPDLKTGDMDFSSVVGKLTSIRVLTTDQPAMATKLTNDLKAAIKTNKMEVLMSANDSGEKTVIYFNTNPDGINDYLLVNEAPTEFNIVLISGKITPADVSRLSGK